MKLWASRRRSLCQPGTKTAAAYLFYLRSRVLKFFNRKLSEPSEHGTAVASARCTQTAPPLYPGIPKGRRQLSEKACQSG